jgi:outer membrane protein assembly factor BamB
MVSRFGLGAILITMVGFSSWPAPSAAADLLSQRAVERLASQRYWQLHLPLVGDETLARIVLLDDNLYALTDTNKVFAVHSRTGVIRWSTLVAEEGKTIRGPSHAAQHVFFTTPGAVRVFHRRTGELASEPRTLRGVIIDVAHDIATVAIGQVHGVRNGDILGVYRLSDQGDFEKKPLARLRITWIDADRSRGRLTVFDKRRRPLPGDRVEAHVRLPLEKVKLPFAASSAAVADDTRVYVGAANQRFYSLNIHSGFEHWQLLTPKTVSSTPLLHQGDLYIAGLDGRVLSCTKDERNKNWVFQTEGPVFADLFIEGEHVYAASSDRSLYCLDRRTGRRVWRERFDTPLTEAPIVSHGRVYQPVTRHGLNVLDAQTGKHLWTWPEAGRFLVQFEEDAYLLTGSSPFQVVRVDAETGRKKAVVDAGLTALATGSHEDQCILLASRAGDLTCLRSEKAPRLKPALLAEVLRDDRKIRPPREVEVGRTERPAGEKPAAQATKKRGRLNLFEEQWLRSRKTGRPIGGHGLVEVEVQPEEAGEDELGDEGIEEDGEDDEFDDEEDEDDDEDEFDDEDEDDETDDEDEDLEDDEEADEEDGEADEEDGEEADEEDDEEEDDE